MTSEERDLYNRMRVFARFHSFAEHEALIQGRKYFLYFSFCFSFFLFFSFFLCLTSLQSYALWIGLLMEVKLRKRVKRVSV